MLGNTYSLRMLNREFLRRRLYPQTKQAFNFHLTGGAFENVQEKTKLSPEERNRMKQKRKEARRNENIENQQKQLKKNAEKQLLVKNQAADGIFPETYNPSYVESKWYDDWIAKGIFSADSPCYQDKKGASNFTMCLPPPNVTGTLHLGHALGCSIQDATSRWHRMKGDSVTWVPGCDHAGIATQVVVEKKLKKELGISRHELGREKFLEEVWKWKEQYGGEILDQMKKLGCSLDWSKLTFTLDPKLSRAVQEAFIRLYDDGLIQRKRRLVNWSCALKSAISDIEVDNLTLSGPTKIKVPGYDREIQFGVMHTFAYPITDSDEKLMVSTTRLETILGDVGVAVHPEDPRYSHLIGRYVLHPFTNMPLPIVPDSVVTPQFGTGAVKLTPGHDPVDFDIATRHNLDIVNIMDGSGCLINVPLEFMNVPRFKARHLVQQKLDSLGLLAGTANHSMTIPICSRSGDVIEYMIKDQWFIDCQQMAGQAIEAVDSGRLEFVPSHYAKQWKEWLKNTKDWCISRQLWWGHRIPAYRISSKDSNSVEPERWVAAHNQQEAELKASKLLGRSTDEVKVVQDEDVLDTWFSSSLVPFSVFGWPDETADLKKLYPTDLLETASDIMFFWVARMVMMGEKLTGQLPFKKVHFHSIVQDAKGRKMSKSLGNVIDPMHIIKGISLEELQARLSTSNLSAEEIKKAKPILNRDFPLGIPECGADALRFALCSFNYHNHFINLDVNFMNFCKTFGNKIWQSFRFMLVKIKQDNGRFDPIDIKQIQHQLTPLDRWLLSRMSGVVNRANGAFESMKLFDATKALQNFWWSEFCSVYMECIKPSLLMEASCDDDDDISNMRKSILVFSFQNFLKLLHPFMPFLSEHLYQELKKVAAIGDGDLNSSISLAAYPEQNEFLKYYDENLEQEMDRILDITSKVNSTKSLFKLDKSVQLPVYLSPGNNPTSSISDHVLVLKTLIRSSNINVLSAEEEVPHGCISLGDVGGCEIHLQLKDIVDKTKQLDDLLKLKEKNEKEKMNLMKHPGLNDMEHNEHLFVKDKITGLKTIIDRIDSMIESVKNI